MEKFDVGDVVELKSGGPDMTIAEIMHDGYFRCQWFCENKLKEGMFSPNSLEKSIEED